MTATPDPPPAVNLRLLDPASTTDVAAVAALIDADPGYVERSEGRPPDPGDATVLLRQAPPGVGATDKVVLGAHTGDALVAVVDLIRGWPQAGTALIGLLQVHPDHQGQGLGRTVHNATLGWIRRTWPETGKLRAVIVATNAPQADPFWAALGYRPHGDPVPYTSDQLQTTAQVWVRDL